MKNFQTDKGTEFFNLDVRSIGNRFNINHYSTYSDKKASIYERFNRTSKNKIWQCFSEQGNYKWIGILLKLVSDYNRTYHSTFRMKPIEVNKTNKSLVRLNIM